MAGTHKERNKDSGVHHNQGEDGGQAVSESISDWTSQEHTNEGTTLAGLEQCALPLCWNDICSVKLDTVCPLEGPQSDEVSIQEHIEGFHDLFDVSFAIDQLYCSLTIVKHMMKAQKQAQGCFLKAAQTPSSCSSFSPSKASFIRSWFPRTSEPFTSECWTSTDPKSSFSLTDDILMECVGRAKKSEVGSRKE